jgi:two-component system, cell cycle response regulator
MYVPSIWASTSFQSRKTSNPTSSLLTYFCNDVSNEVKQHHALKGVPVVLMWSGFVELDEDKFQASMADAQLEKPFDVAALRKLVTDLVPRTQNQRISRFLTFPTMPELEEQRPEAAMEEPPGLAGDQEDFQQVPIPQMKSAQAGRFKLDLKPEELDDDHVPVDYSVPDDAPSAPAPQAKPQEAAPPADEDEEFSFGGFDAQSGGADDEILEVEDPVEPPPVAVAPSKPLSTPALPQLSEEQLEKVIRAQSAEIIESVVWRVVPELATQIIERELNRLLKERDSHP